MAAHQQGRTMSEKNGAVAQTGESDLSVGQLAKRFGLSRSTLLYYDSIGLLHPSGRSEANYRQYTQEDGRRLQLICMYRQIGLSMASIGKILDSPQSGIRAVLETRLLDLSEEIGRLREQQHIIIRMLGDVPPAGRLPVMDKENWVTLLRATGLDDQAMERWHKEFERLSPQLHQEFLQGLGIGSEEIEQIRAWARG